MGMLIINLTVYYAIWLDSESGSISMLENVDKLQNLALNPTLTVTLRSNLNPDPNYPDQPYIRP